jgi:tetratricopeptide (TPR) repeat protein
MNNQPNSVAVIAQGLTMNLTRCLTMMTLAALVLSAPLFAAIEPAPGTVITEEKAITDAWIESETTDGVVFYLGDWRSPTRVAVNRKRGQYKSVVYTGNGSDANFLRAEVLYSNQDFDKASEFYKKATTTAKWNWEVEQSFRRGAQSFARSNKAAEALGMIKDYLAKYPKNVHMAEVISLRAQLSLTSGDHAGATADFKEMVKQAKEWSPTAELEGYLGQRAVLNAQKKEADAVALLSGYWAKIKVTEDPSAFAQVGLALAADVLALGKPDESVAFLRKLYLAPIAVEDQSKAHLEHAKILAKANNTENNLAAFDRAAIAALLGGDESTQNAAIKLAREMLSRIDKDSKIADDVRKDYRSYAGSL